MTTTQLVAEMNLPAYLLLAASALVLTVLLLRPLAFNGYDPIFVSNGQVIGFSLAMMAYLYFVEKMVSLSDLMYVVVATGAFVSGAYWTKQRLWTRSLYEAIHSLSKAGEASELGFARTMVVVSSALLAVVFLVRAATVGLPIFSPDPDFQKIVVTTGGNGGLARVTETLTYCTLILLCYLRRIGGAGKLTNLLFILPLAILAASGSKSAFLSVFYAYCFANIYVSLRRGERLNVISTTGFFAVVIIVLAYAALVVFLQAINGGMDASDTNLFVAVRVLIRFVATGEGVFYYFTQLQHTLSHSASEFLSYYLMQPLFAPLRLVAYDRALGSQMGYMMTNSELLGPFPTMFVEGRVFFGYLGGICYALCLGALLSWFRFMPLYLRLRSDVLRLLIFCIANILILEIGKDMTLFLGYVLNYVLIVPLVVVISMMVHIVGVPARTPPSVSGLHG